MIFEERKKNAEEPKNCRIDTHAHIQSYMIIWKEMAKESKIAFDEANERDQDWSRMFTIQYDFIEGILQEWKANENREEKNEKLIIRYVPSSFVCISVIDVLFKNVIFLHITFEARPKSHW